MNWRNRLSELAGNQGDIRFDFRKPASLQEITVLESTLSARMPAALKELLLQTNGVMEELAVEGDWIENKWLIWPVGMIAHENLVGRRQYAKNLQDLDALLFFASAGCDGILFAHPSENENSYASRVVAWLPIEGELQPLASSLEEFLEGWTNGSANIT